MQIAITNEAGQLVDGILWIRSSPVVFQAGPGSLGCQLPAADVWPRLLRLETDYGVSLAELEAFVSEPPVLEALRACLTSTVLERFAVADARGKAALMSNAAQSEYVPGFTAADAASPFAVDFFRTDFPAAVANLDLAGVRALWLEMMTE
jgi:hypothetical protein